MVTGCREGCFEVIHVAHDCAKPKTHPLPLLFCLSVTPMGCCASDMSVAGTKARWALYAVRGCTERNHLQNSPLHWEVLRQIHSAVNFDMTGINLTQNFVPEAFSFQRCWNYQLLVQTIDIASRQKPWGCRQQNARWRRGLLAVRRVPPLGTSKGRRAQQVPRSRCLARRIAPRRLGSVISPVNAKPFQILLKQPFCPRRAVSSTLMVPVLCQYLQAVSGPPQALLPCVWREGGGLLPDFAVLFWILLWQNFWQGPLGCSTLPLRAPMLWILFGQSFRQRRLGSDASSVHARYFRSLYFRSFPRNASVMMNGLIVHVTR